MYYADMRYSRVFVYYYTSYDKQYLRMMWNNQLASIDNFREQDIDKAEIEVGQRCHA